MHTEARTPGGARRWHVVCLLAAILLGAIAVRTWQLPHESAWWDEVVSLRCLPAPTLGAFIHCERASDSPMTPVYFAVAYAWSRTVSSTELGMRVLSLLFGMAALVMVFLLGRRLFGERPGLMAALVFAASLPHIYYAQEIRVYALVTCLAALSVYALVEALRSHHKAWWALHMAANILLAFTHLFTILLFVAEGLFLLKMLWADGQSTPPTNPRWRWRHWMIWGLLHAGILLALAVWLQGVNTADIHNAASWMVRPGPREAVMAALIFAGGRPTNENPSTHLPTGFSLDIPLAAVVFILIGWHLWHTRTKTQDHTATWLLACWLAVPLAGLFVASWVWRPCFVYRYILYASLPVYILLGAAIDALPRRFKRIVACMLVALYGHQLSALAVGPFRADWRSACRFVEDSAADRDTFIAYQDLNLWAMEYHSAWPRERLDCAQVWTDVPEHVRQAHERGGTAYVAVWLWADPSRIEARFAENGWHYTYVDFNSWPRLRVYRVP